MTINNLTEEEKNAISKLRNGMRNEIPPEIFQDTLFFYRFLKACNFNINQSESMLRKSLRWRKSMQVDTIITDFKPSEVLIKYTSHSFIGFDKEGCAINYIAIGNIDGKGICKSANKFTILKCVIQETEKLVSRLQAQSIKLETPVTQCVYIYDMENITFAKATHKDSIYMFMEGSSVFQDNYPEFLKRVVFINASRYFTIAFQLVKTVLQGELIKKIKVFGNDGWREELLGMIDEDVLPTFLGGRKTDPDGNPLCTTFVQRAGPIPESYYLTKDIQKIAQKPDVKHIIIDRNSRIEIPVYLKNPKSILHWEFELKFHDINFSVSMQNLTGDTFVLIPPIKLETEFEPETGQYRCENMGTYNIIFDNTYSWFHSKEIYYRTWVTDVDEKRSNW